MKFSVAIRPNDITQFKTVEVERVKELGEIACKSNISTSVFKNGYRTIDNFEFAECIGLDFDNVEANSKTPPLTLEQAKEVFKPFKHLILATRNHQVLKKGKTVDRFRIILFLEEPITNADDFYATWYSLHKFCPSIDDKCKDPSRFWYRHKEVLGGGQGQLVKPVKYVKPEPKELPKFEPGQHGELSRETLKHLEFGIPKGIGMRNGAVYKMAKDFQQNLYTPEETEARIIEALSRTDTLDNEFDENEAIRTIQSAFSRDPKHEPRLGENEPNSGNRAFTYFTLAEVLSIPDKQDDWLVEGLLIKGGLSMIVGVPKIGKTTLVRQLERSILRGEPFLGRKTEKGKIVHYSFDEKAKTAKRHYRTLGLTQEDPLILHFGAAGTETHLKEFEEDLMNLKPLIAIVDTLFDMAEVEDINAYIPIKKKLTHFGTIAEKTNCHILFIHHQNKPNQNYTSGSGLNVLGSQAIFGSVDCCMVFEQVKDSPLRTLAVHGRGIEAFDQTQLRFNKETQTYVIEKIKDMFE